MLLCRPADCVILLRSVAFTRLCFSRHFLLTPHRNLRVSCWSGTAASLRGPGSNDANVKSTPRFYSAHSESWYMLILSKVTRVVEPHGKLDISRYLYQSRGWYKSVDKGRDIRHKKVKAKVWWIPVTVRLERTNSQASGAHSIFCLSFLWKRVYEIRKLENIFFRLDYCTVDRAYNGILNRGGQSPIPFEQAPTPLRQNSRLHARLWKHIPFH
jgi:hypothetical protein